MLVVRASYTEDRCAVGSRASASGSAARVAGEASDTTVAFAVYGSFTPVQTALHLILRDASCEPSASFGRAELCAFWLLARQRRRAGDAGQGQWPRDLGGRDPIALQCLC